MPRLEQPKGFSFPPRVMGLNLNLPRADTETHLAIRNLVEEENVVACTVFISADTGQTAFGTSYFKFKDGKIIEVDEYWGEEYDAPENRKKWAVSL